MDFEVSSAHHTQAYENLKQALELWWNGNISRLEYLAKVAAILSEHEALEGGN